MSTTIQVPGSAILESISETLIRAQDNIKSSEADLERVKTDPTTVPMGYVYLGAVEKARLAHQWRDHLLVLKLAANNGWQITLGRDDFYLLKK